MKSGDHPEVAQYEVRAKLHTGVPITTIYPSDQPWKLLPLYLKSKSVITFTFRIVVFIE
jgi:hypothetical protein